MRQISFSVLALFIVLPAFADARLPVVNLSSGAVSARAAFGEPIVKSTTKSTTQSAKTTETVAVNNNNNQTNSQKNKSTESKRNVVARSSVQNRVVEKASVQKDSGEEIIASADVLTPRRPSSDLWAKSDAPLRLPQPEEFSVIKSDFELPEESLDRSSQKTNTVIARSSERVSQPVASESKKISNRPMSELDEQIARLNELQRRADESVDDVDNSVRVASARPQSFVNNNSNAVEQTRQIAKNEDDDIKLSRMVVPMDDDVVVRAVQKVESPRIASVREDMTTMSPTELRKAFRKTFLSENKHLSTFQIDDRFDVASDMTSSVEGFTSERDLSESGGIRPLEIKIKFRNDDSALSRDNYNLLTEYAGIVLSNPTRAVQVSIPQSVVNNTDDRKLAARRLAIVEQVLRDTGISEQRILPVLSQRDEDGLVLRMISLDQYETLTQQQRDMFGDTVSKKTYKSMSW